jgi:hypothetical protein
MQQLYGNIYTGGKPLVCSYASYLQAGIAAATVGKKVAINYVVRKVCGVEPWTNV